MQEKSFGRDRQKLARLVAGLLTVGALLIYGMALSARMNAYAGAADSSGYLNDARLLSDRQLIVEQRIINGLPVDQLPRRAYIPLGFVPKGFHQMVPTYPMGYPLMILAMSNFVGWQNAAAATTLLHALVSIVAMYFLAIVCGLSRPFAVLAAIMLGSSVIFIFQATIAMSDVPALAWCSLAILFAMLARRDDRWALASGVAVAVSVLIRPTDVLVMVPVAVALGLSWRKWAWLLLGALPGVLFAAWINLILYGKVLTTGYGDVKGLFSLKNAVLGLEAYAHWLPLMLTPAVIVIFAAPVLLRSRRYVLAVLSSWIFVLLGFYSAYQPTHDNWTYMRFPMPAFGAIIVLMLLVCQQLLLRFNLVARRIAGVGALVFVLTWNWHWASSFGMFHTGPGEKTYLLAAEWSKANLPKDSVLVSMQTSGALLYYTNFIIVRWDQFTKDTFSVVEEKSEADRLPIYAVLFQFEKAEVRQRMPGQWDFVKAFDQIEIWQRVRTN